MLRSERDVEEMPLKCLPTKVKASSLHMRRPLTLCLAVVYVCYEKALKILSGSDQRFITDAVQSDVWLPQKYFFYLVVCALLYNNIMAL